MMQGPRVTPEPFPEIAIRQAMDVIPVQKGGRVFGSDF
jgi:hypothetical protein